MKYRVVIAQDVTDAVDAQVTYLLSAGAPPERLGRWMERLYDLIDSLYSWPRRFAVAEAVSDVKGYEVRRANFDEYAIYYRVDDKRKLVEVIAFRHGRQRPWMESEVESV